MSQEPAWNRTFFRTIRVRDGTIADYAYEEPFAALLGSHKGSMVVLKDRCANRPAHIAMMEPSRLSLGSLSSAR